MIEFTELYITPDNKHLVVGIKVKDEEYLKDVYIDSVTIDNHETYSSGRQSFHPLVYKEFTTDKKYYKLEFDKVSLGSLNSIFFIYVKARGVPSIDTPCGMDNITTTGVIANMYPIYQQGMNYIRELEDTCEVSQNFSDFILQTSAIELALKTGNYTSAVRYFKKFIKYNKADNRIGGCGCGRKRV